MRSRRTRRTFRDHAVCGALSDVASPEDLEPDVIIGGPPCQGFSVIGRMDPNDARSERVQRFLDQVERFEPRAFCMENVKALAVNERWRGIRDALIERAESLGHATELLVLNAADYGVPKHGSACSSSVLAVGGSICRSPQQRMSASQSGWPCLSSLPSDSRVTTRLQSTGCACAGACDAALGASRQSALQRVRATIAARRCRDDSAGVDERHCHSDRRPARA